MGLFSRLVAARQPAVPQSASIPRQEAWHRDAPSLGATWLQPYTFRACGRLFDVVGESQYQQALEAASGGRTRDGAAYPLVTALLVREPRNPFDRNAVRIDVGGQTVGYIPRGWTDSFHPVLDAIDRLQLLPTCRAWLTGGWDRGDLDRGHFGIRLDLHEQLQVVENAVLLPFGNGRISVTGEERCQPHLAELLGAQDRLEAVAVLDHGNDRLTVSVGDQFVGELTGKMSMRFSPWINELRRVGLPPTAEARIVRGDRKVEVFLKLAKPW